MYDWKVKTTSIPCLKNKANGLIDMDLPENDCPELTEKTADAIDDASLRELFITTQQNNLDICVKAGLK